MAGLQKFKKLTGGKNFKIIAEDGLARAGVLKTAHGEIETPVFMPVGTQGTVKALSPEDLESIGAQVILGNTYHLYLRPGSKLVKKMGGLHKFMNWNGPILTDSGGFQAFSLGAMIEHGIKKVPARKCYALSVAGGQNAKFKAQSSDRRKQRVDLNDNRTVFSKIREDGVEFSSHLDGSKHLLTPEKSIEVQLDLGSDIVLVLDELLSPAHSKEYIARSLSRTHRWELESKDYFLKNVSKSVNPGALIFGILQGIDNYEIRTNEARWIADKGFDGISIGGSFGSSESKTGGNTDWGSSHAIDETMGWVTPLLPRELARHALGIGEVVDFFECIERGVDMFDCVAPSRRARNGSLYIRPENGGNKENSFTLIISNAKHKEDRLAIDPGCSCYTCQNFTRSYLRHLYISGELLYHRLATIHNLYFMLNLVQKIRESIINKQFKRFKKEYLGK